MSMMVSLGIERSPSLNRHSWAAQRCEGHSGRASGASESRNPVTRGDSSFPRAQDRPVRVYWMPAFAGMTTARSDKRARLLQVSKLHAVGALEAENLARLLRAGDLIAELLHDSPHLGNLLGVALGELAAADIEAVLKADAHIAAHHHRLGGERNLEAAGAQHRPVIVVTEQLVGGALHEQEVVDVGADAAEDTENEL